jgi:hypothetical protein
MNNKHRIEMKVVLTSVNKWHRNINVCVCVCVCVCVYIYIHTHTHTHRGLFICPSGISELCSAITKTDTAERSITTDRETLQHSCVIMAYLRVLPLEGSCVEKWLLSTMEWCSVCGRNWITGLTSAASTEVDIWSTCKVGHTFGELLYLLICSFLRCLSWLLYCRVRKSRRDLWITLYNKQMLWFVGLVDW